MTNMIKKTSLAVMSAFYFIAGLYHFLKPEDYLRIMPPYFPAHDLMVALSGGAEMLLAALLPWPKTRRPACFGIIALLVAVLPANVYMLTSGGAGFSYPQWLLICRIPFQGVLMLWAYWHTGEKP